MNNNNKYTVPEIRLCMGWPATFNDKVSHLFIDDMDLRNHIDNRLSLLKEIPQYEKIRNKCLTKLLLRLYEN